MGRAMPRPATCATKASASQNSTGIPLRPYDALPSHSVSTCPPHIRNTRVTGATRHMMALLPKRQSPWSAARSPPAAAAETPGISTSVALSSASRA